MNKWQIICPVAAMVLVALAVGLIHEHNEEGGVRAACASNLRQLDGAKQMWAQEFHKTPDDTPTWDDLRHYFKDMFLKCPNGGTYTIGRVGDLARCSIPKHASDYAKNVSTGHN